jgi:hypothetical protein
MEDKPTPMILQFRRSDLDKIFEGLRNVPRTGFIGLCRYRGGTIGKKPASYFIVKLTYEEAAYIALKVDMIVTKLPEEEVDIAFTQNVETYYFE